MGMMRVTVLLLLFSAPAVVLTRGQSLYSDDKKDCPLPTPCAAPPMGCDYIRPEPNAKGCIVGCGKLFCEPKDECPVFSCAPPPDIDSEICTFGLPDYDFSTGCPLSCPPLERCCPLPTPCAAPPDGCRYIPPKPRADGCVVGCGTLSCFCQDLVCMAPGFGCSYGPRTFDDQRCPTSCGELTCNPPALPVCPLCEDPCARVRCGLGRKCEPRKPRRQYDSDGCPTCAKSARCVRRRFRPPYLRP